MKRFIPSIILVRPQLPENIGLTARAMQNCGLSKLIIVSPREKWPNKIAINASANAKLIIKNAIIYNSVDEAVSKFNFLVALSARNRFLQKPHQNKFDTLFKKIPKFQKFAFVFGPEQSGLSNKDLALCDYIFTIPTHKNNRSLNLSHSVLLISYKWQEYSKIFSLNPINKEKLSDKKSFNILMKFLKNELDKSGFLFPKEKSPSMFSNIQSMFLRANLSKNEIQTLWGMIKTLKNPRKR